MIVHLSLDNAKKHILSFAFLIMLWSSQTRSYKIFPELVGK